MTNKGTRWWPLSGANHRRRRRQHDTWQTHNFRRWTCVRKNNNDRSAMGGKCAVRASLLSPTFGLLRSQHRRTVIDVRVLFYVFPRFIFGGCCAQAEWQRGVDILSFPQGLDPVMYRTLQTPVNAFTASTHPKLSSANCRILFKRSHIRLT